MNNKLFFFILVILLIGLPLLLNEIAYYYFSDDIVTAKVAQKLRNKTPQVVAVGSSRAQASLHPDAFHSDLLILGLPMMDIYTKKMVVQGFSENLKKARLVIIEYNPEMFFIKTLDRPGNMNTIMELRVPFIDGYLDWQNHRPWRANFLLPYLTRSRFTPREFLAQQRHKGSYRQIELEFKRLREFGFIGHRRTQSEERLISEGEIKVKGYGRRFSPELFERGVEVFEEMIEFLEQSGIKFCFIRFPLHPRFHALADQEFAQIIKRTGPIASQRRCLKGTINSNHMKFSDPDHLHHHSAMEFSEKLVEELLKSGY